MYLNEKIWNCFVNHIEALTQKQELLSGSSSTTYELCDFEASVWTFVSLFINNRGILGAPALRTIVMVTWVHRVKPWKQYLAQTSAG